MALPEVDRPPVDGYSTNDRTEPCGHGHVPTFEPRQLCLVRRPALRADCDAPLLDVRVSACPPSESETASALVVLTGSLDSYSAAQVHEILTDFAIFARFVVLDLAAVQTIDSGGVVLIESLEAELAKRGGRLWIHDPSLIVERVLQICGTTDRIRPCRPVREQRTWQ